MNNKNRRPPNRRPDQAEPRFCPRCGGALTGQNIIHQTNVCRCKKS
jgi:hypothetical protein